MNDCFPQNRVPVKVLDYKPTPIECFNGAWALYDVTVEMPSGRILDGSMQGDTRMWAFETFEES